MKKNHPGPGERLELTFYNKPNPQQTKFGKGKKGLDTPKKRAPSPGTYDHHNTVGDGLKCSIGGGLKFQQRIKLPKEQKLKNQIGPGNYCPSTYNKIKPPKYSIGYRTQSNFVNRNGDPNGPGQYYMDEYDKKQQHLDEKITCSQIREKYEDMRQRSQSQKTKRNEFNSTQQQMSSTMRYTQTGFMSSAMVRSYHESGFGYGQRTQLNKNITGVPGPGTYDLNFAQVENNRKFKIGERTESKNNNQDNPGPDQYDFLTKKGTIKNPKQFTLSGKTKNIEKVDMVDVPVSYDAKLLDKKMKIKFGKGQRSKLELSKFQQSVPGPGNYEIIQQSSAGFKYSFGKDVRDKDLRDFKSQQDDSSFGYNYMGNGQFSSSKDDLLGLTERAEKKKKKGFPGPGHYEIIRDDNEARKFELRGRGEKPNKAYKIVYPGPGNYEYKSVEKNQRQGDIGKSSRFENRRKLETPGPGSYDVCTKFDGRKSGFGKINKKPQIYKLPQPGPGSYEIPTTVAYIPKYLVKNKQVNELQNLENVVEF